MELYTADTPNGEKIHIALCELGLRARITKLDLAKGQQREPEFLAVSPNGKIPAFRDGTVTVFESGAILMHLAESYGRLVPKDAALAAQARSWLFWQTSSVGPTFGSLHAFMSSEPPVASAIQRFQREAKRLFGVLNTRLVGRDFIADEFSIADIACFPWMREPEFLGVDPESIPEVIDWIARMAARPGVRAGLELLDN